VPSKHEEEQDEEEDQKDEDVNQVIEALKAQLQKENQLRSQLMQENDRLKGQLETEKKRKREDQSESIQLQTPFQTPHSVPPTPQTTESILQHVLISLIPLITLQETYTNPQTPLQTPHTLPQFKTPTTQQKPPIPPPRSSSIKSKPSTHMDGIPLDILKALPDLSALNVKDANLQQLLQLQQQILTLQQERIGNMGSVPTSQEDALLDMLENWINQCNTLIDNLEKGLTTSIQTPQNNNSVNNVERTPLRYRISMR
jgi:hypothetical protein